MNILRTIIIEDEKPAQDLLARWLKAIPQIEVVAICSDGFSGVKTIAEHKPDLIFLDIQMPKLTGFEMLELLDELPKIIFTTAYNEYAVKAFETGAVDYLLKPFSNSRLLDAIEKARHQVSMGEKLASVKQVMQQNEGNIERVVVKNGSEISIIPVSDIIYIESQDDYVMINTADAHFLKHDTMKFYETGLDTGKFVRIHRKYIVAIVAIKQIELYKKDSYLLWLHQGEKLTISKSGYKKLKKILNF